MSYKVGTTNKRVVIHNISLHWNRFQISRKLWVRFRGFNDDEERNATERRAVVLVRAVCIVVESILLVYQIPLVLSLSIRANGRDLNILTTIKD